MKDIDCLVVNGDSYSAPQDFPVYADVLADHLKVPLYNLAIVGSSNDRILRSTVQSCEDIRKKYRNPLFIIGWSFLHRLEIWYHGPNEKVLARAPDQPNDGTQLRLMTLDWVPDDEISRGTKDFLTSIDTVDKKIVDWYLHIYLLSEIFTSKKIPYLFFSAANNCDFPVKSFPALQHFSFVQQVESDPRIHELGTFCIQRWAENNDPGRDKNTGHLSAAGHRAFATFIMEKML